MATKIKVNFSKIQAKTYDELVLLLQNQFIGKTIMFKERKKFYDVKQDECESVLNLFNKIQALSVKCKFGDQLDKIICDKFICGLNRNGVFERLCDEKVGFKSAAYLKLALTKEVSMLAACENVHKI